MSTGFWSVRQAGVGLAVLVVLGVAVAGCVPATGTTCDQDDECPAGYHCSADRLCVNNAVTQDAGRIDAAAADHRETDRVGSDHAVADHGPLDRARVDASDAAVGTDTSRREAGRPDSSRPDTNGSDRVLLPGANCGSRDQCSTGLCYKSVCCAETASACSENECQRCQPGSGICIGDEGVLCRVDETRNCSELVYGVEGANCVAYASYLIQRHCLSDGSCGQIDLVIDCANHRLPGVVLDSCGSERCVSDNHECFGDISVSDYSGLGFCVTDGVTIACNTDCYGGTYGWSLNYWSCDANSNCQANTSLSCGNYVCRNGECLTTCSGNNDCFWATCVTTDCQT